MKIPAASEGYLGFLRSFGSGLVGAAHDRFELFTLELQEEKLRLFQTLIWISAAIFIGMMTIAFLSFTVISLVGESARPTALGGMTAFYLAVFGMIVLDFRRHQARQSKPFAATLSELREDCACIRTKS